MFLRRHDVYANDMLTLFHAAGCFATPTAYALFALLFSPIMLLPLRFSPPLMEIVDDRNAGLERYNSAAA